MLHIFLKNFFVYASFIIFILKTLNIKTNNKHQKILCFVAPLLPTFITCILRLSVPEFAHTITILLMWILISHFIQMPKNAFIACVLSFGYSYTLYALSAFIVSLLASLIHIEVTPIFYNFLIILSGVVQLNATIYLCKIKRFRSGLPLLSSHNFINLATSLCLIILFFVSYVKLNKYMLEIQLITLLLIIIALAFLIHWWQAQITKTYKQSVILRNNESLTGELEEAYKKIARLESQNEEQGRLIHHDNKRLAAMENAIHEYLLSDFSNVEATKDRGNTLCLEIQSLSRNRSDTLKEIYEKKTRHYTTGISSLDTLLNYMDKRATEENIQFTVHNSLELETHIPKQISIEDLTHVLSDLLENAIIATKGTNSPAIQLQFYVSEKHFVIEVADSGIPFETKSIVNYGLSRLTTHEATGGSGIGLMDIWSIKEKYDATLHIEEYEIAVPFTKKISLVFNRKNLYSVRTWRADELNALSKRNDLRVYNYTD